MKREIRFRAWSTEGRMMVGVTDINFKDMTYSCRASESSGWTDSLNECVLMQYTGLKDRNGFQEVYEGDILDEYGNIKGNTYEMDAGEADFIIQGFGDKDWGATYKEAVERGCKEYFVPVRRRDRGMSL